MGGKDKKKNSRHKKNKIKSTNIDILHEDRHESPDVNEEADLLDQVNLNKPPKRHNEDEDSDTGDKPLKKKKKKLPALEESSDKKGKKSNRQKKRERYAQRLAEAQAVAKSELKSHCLNYLSQWKHDKANWKFMKAKQVWLYKNKFSSKLLPDESWPLLLEYFESAQGNIRNMLLEDAKKVIKLMDDWMESQDNEKSEENEIENTDITSNKPDEITYKRARDLIQCLQE